ncbi:MAG: SDR family oxidoreductase [Novosphingobium sp.]|nr:SDR family oxidoreductase [Novosphingobium sp.]
MLDPARLFSLAGKVAVVTGAASGIGKATAILFANAGATVVVADKDGNGARAVADMLGAGHAAMAFDLADDAAIVALFAEIGQRFGRCDVLVNNAGIYPKYRFDDLTEPQWQDMQRVNVWGCFVALREAARVMRESGQGGRIIIVSSIGAVRTAVEHQLAYNASKAALDSMTKSAALELAKDGILVNSVCPGGVMPLDPKPREPGHVPATGPLMNPGRMLTGRPAEPHEVAGPILMLASAAGGNFTGQCLVMDSGFSIS